MTTDFNPSLQRHLIAFVDGASSGNPGPGGWGLIILTPDRRITEQGGREAATTNNRMELLAAIHAVEQAKLKSLAAEIYSDSTYVIRGITQWIWAWRKNNWLSSEGNPVLNKDLWIRLSELTSNCAVKW